MAQYRQFCTFYLDELFLGVAIEQVQEVIRAQPMTRVPRANSAIAGLINLRGEIVTAINLRCCFGLRGRAAGEAPTNVIIRRDGGDPASLLVDQVDDVLNLSSVHREAVPATLRGPQRELISGVYKLDKRLLLILDCEQVLTMPLAQLR